MAGTRFTFTVAGTTQVDRTLARFGEGVKNARPLWDVLAADFARIESRQFASQGGESGGWQGLSPGYAAWKAKHYPGQPLMVRTGHLRESLTARPFAVERITQESMTIGTDVRYAEYHQRGSGRLPRRPVVSLSEANRRKWTNIMQRYIVTGKV